MAKRFGGKYSPDGQSAGVRAEAIDIRQIKAAGSPARLLYLPAIILVFTSLGSGPATLVLALIGSGVLTLAAWMLQEGLKAEAEYNARKVARRPAVPRKILASALTGIGAAIAAYTGDSGTIGSALYGVAALGLHVAAFGIDPMADKRMEGVDMFQQDRVARVVDEAEAHLDVMKAQIEGLSDRRLTERVQDFQVIARRMIRTVEEDPRDLTGARKFLSVYLMGARDATVKFVDLYGRNKDAEARASYEALLDDLEQNFAARTEKMLLDDRSDMDIEINVLRDRLQREGVSLKTKGSE
ncbi:5-bromo-4-chloroindolyl phosphate hydrolysis family protein [Cognatiyoonia sp. IB215182]|uniref:5-bromo-4-chloroindolyl phosphate hydrolysis family protein n=1 Tax=Cognatiyoonia sp. IB215182 TaxID=3097353 RepID=UPI002A0BF19E|nr:5-bromo-4-chloroindolyl phosphate hydrolysis family protein [Cognatiyoonia sp. IB215182]MDX8351034.1 5-bromo-4-chloroindolyl phosphate hydrolysis family protein [Cognatiyoonia sp. IB215182]